MLETLLALTAAHLIADFPLQPQWIVDRKRKTIVLAVHVAIVTLLAALLTGSLDWRVWLVVAVTHALMDFVKVRFLARAGLWGFLLDQAVHIAVLVAVAAWRPETVAEGWYGGWSTELQRLACQGLALVSGAIAAVMGGGIVTKLLLDQVAAAAGPAPAAAANTAPPAAPTTADGDQSGLPKGGAYIGMLERGLILVFLLIGQPEGIGFMLAAKSVLRFSDRSARAHTEYVIIGTLASFGWAILAALLTRAALGHWG